MTAGAWITVLGVLAVILLFVYEDQQQRELLARLEVSLDER